MTRATRSAIAAAAALTAVAGVHAYWALGGRWPGHDEASLTARVVGDTSEFPPSVATWAVVVLLLTGACLLLGQVRLLRLPLPARLVRVAVCLLVGCLALRGIVGALTSTVTLLHGTDVPYYRLDVMAYSPFCLLLAALCFLAQRDIGEHSDATTTRGG